MFGCPRAPACALSIRVSYQPHPRWPSRLRHLAHRERLVLYTSTERVRLLCFSLRAIDPAWSISATRLFERVFAPSDEHQAFFRAQNQYSVAYVCKTCASRPCVAFQCANSYVAQPDINPYTRNTRALPSPLGPLPALQRPLDDKLLCTRTCAFCPVVCRYSWLPSDVTLFLQNHQHPFLLFRYPTYAVSSTRTCTTNWGCAKLYLTCPDRVLVLAYRLVSSRHACNHFPKSRKRSARTAHALAQTVRA